MVQFSGSICPPGLRSGLTLQAVSVSSHLSRRRISSDLILCTALGVGVRNNNKRKESARVREVCSNCQFFLAKQVHFHLASRLSKSRVKTKNRKVSKAMGNRQPEGRQDRIRLAMGTRSGYRQEPEFRKLAGSQESAGFEATGPTDAPVQVWRRFTGNKFPDPPPSHHTCAFSA